jgi:hypothetical protein
MPRGQLSIYVCRHLSAINIYYSIFDSCMVRLSILQFISNSSRSHVPGYGTSRLWLTAKRLVGKVIVDPDHNGFRSPKVRVGFVSRSALQYVPWLFAELGKMNLYFCKVCIGIALLRKQGFRVYSSYGPKMDQGSSERPFPYRLQFSRIPFRASASIVQ